MIGPTVIPFRNLSGRYEGTPNLPALHGRYLAVDLDENNRRPPGTFGWGVCRQGFGLQNLGRLTKAQAEEEARRLNAVVPTAEREAFSAPCTACGSIVVENGHCVCCGRSR